MARSPSRGRWAVTWSSSVGTCHPCRLPTPLQKTTRQAPLVQQQHLRCNPQHSCPCQPRTWPVHGFPHRSHPRRAHARHRRPETHRGGCGVGRRPCSRLLRQGSPTRAAGAQVGGRSDGAQNALNALTRCVARLGPGWISSRVAEGLGGADEADEGSTMSSSMSSRVARLVTGAPVEARLIAPTASTCSLALICAQGGRGRQTAVSPAPCSRTREPKHAPHLLHERVPCHFVRDGDRDFSPGPGPPDGHEHELGLLLQDRSRVSLSSPQQ